MLTEIVEGGVDEGVDSVQGANSVQGTEDVLANVDSVVEGGVDARTDNNSVVETQEEINSRIERAKAAACYGC